jgi:hypothetical protein
MGGGTGFVSDYMGVPLFIHCKNIKFPKTLVSHETNFTFPFAIICEFFITMGKKNKFRAHYFSDFV